MIIALPPTLPIEKQNWGTRNFDLTFENPDNAASQTAIFGPARWTCSLVSEERIPNMAEAAAWRTLVLALNGRVNQLAVYDLLNPVPRGTARGAWTAAAAELGATSLQINMGPGQAGKTLLQGDFIGVNQDALHRQLLHVQADAVANGAGVITVAFMPPLVRDVAGGSAVVWDRPTCLMRRTTSEMNWASVKRAQGGFGLDLLQSYE